MVGGSDNLSWNPYFEFFIDDRKIVSKSKQELFRFEIKFWVVPKKSKTGLRKKINENQKVSEPHWDKDQHFIQKFTIFQISNSSEFIDKKCDFSPLCKPRL